MKLKYLIIISLILTFLTIGAACATEDTSGVSDEINNSTNEINTINQEIESDYLTHSDESEVGISEDVDWDISSEVYIDEDEDVVYFRSYDTSETGTLKVYVDNTLKYNHKITSSDYHYDSDDEEYEYRLYLSPYDLDMVNYRTYNVKLTFNDETLEQNNVKIIYPMDVYINSLEENTEDICSIGETLEVYMSLPEDATDRLTLFVNGKSYNINYQNGEAKLYLNTTDWIVGKYTAKLSYNGDSKYPFDYVERSFEITPKFTNPNVISKGENEFITINSNSGLNGNVRLYKYSDEKYDDGKKTLIGYFDIINGHGSYSLSNLASGKYYLSAEYTVGGFKSEYVFDITVKDNSPQFTSSISASEITWGSSVTVKVKGPKVNSFVGFYLDDNEIESLNLSQGEVSKAISGLSVGTHKINVFFDVNNQFYSKTFFVSVKKPANTVHKPLTLALKTIKVKKSAKKIVLQATLKQGKDPLKKRKIVFKFNGKKYFSKTNKKGIAKVIINKKALKKLKVGKKVKYQAAYGKLIVKIGVKVKK